MIIMMIIMVIMTIIMVIMIIIMVIMIIIMIIMIIIMVIMIIIMVIMIIMTIIMISAAVVQQWCTGAAVGQHCTPPKPTSSRAPPTHRTWACWGGALLLVGCSGAAVVQQWSTGAAVVGGGWWARGCNTHQRSSRPGNLGPVMQKNWLGCHPNQFFCVKGPR